MENTTRYLLIATGIIAIVVIVVLLYIMVTGNTT
jgi:hypothetical protein